jgi:hypothetical protein
MFIWTPESFAQLQSLRSDGLSQGKCARIIGCSASQVFKVLHPEKKKLKPTALPKPSPPPRKFHHHHVASVPMRRHINPKARNAPPLTREQMYYDLARAVRNTLRLALR